MDYNLVNNIGSTKFNEINNFIIYKKLKFECLYIYNNIPNKLNISKSILDQFNLSFHNMINVSTVNSPIIDQVNYNTKFLFNIHTVDQ